MGIKPHSYYCVYARQYESEGKKKANAPYKRSRRSLSPSAPSENPLLPSGIPFRPTRDRAEGRKRERQGEGVLKVQIETTAQRWGGAWEHGPILGRRRDGETTRWKNARHVTLLRKTITWAMGRVASIVSRGVCGTVEVLTQWDAQHLSTALAGGTEFVPQKNLWVMREDVASGAKRNSLRSFFRRMQRAGRCHDLHYSIFSRTLEPLGLQRPQTHFEFLQRIFQCLRHHKREEIRLGFLLILSWSILEVEPESGGPIIVGFLG
ncbi:hypothetical protein DFH06DRAFT_1137431 [Mycena polygramma]|nr:hypothetical protein DFH06DRAFT_1137431 [Mycena polygramma]